MPAFRSTPKAPAYGSISRRAFLVAAGAAGVALGGGAAAPANAATTVPAFSGIGISANSGLLAESADSQVQSFAFMRALGVQNLRIDIPWRWIEQTRGSLIWTGLDRVVDLARGDGMSILGVFTTTPPWAALGGSSNQQTRPADPAAWARFISLAVQRYRGRISAYELWNEPNGRQYFAPDPDPVAYAAMTRAAVPAIRSADPSAIILAAGLGPAPDADGLMSPVRFFRQMLDAGIGAVDAYAFHPYDAQSMSDAARWDGTPTREVVEMQRILRARGEGEKRIWATEYGADSRAVGADAQNALVISGMMQWNESAFAGPLFIHHHRDQSAADGFGLAAVDLSPKPAAYSAQWFGNNGVPLRHEALVFSQNADAKLGRPVGPVFPLPDGYGQDYENGVRFATPAGWLSSPPEIGDLLRRAGRVPLRPFADGMQDVLIPELGSGAGGRAFLSSAGAFLVVGAILAVWNPGLGFPVSDQRVEKGVTIQDFSVGRITWSPSAGATAVKTS